MHSMILCYRYQFPPMSSWAYKLVGLFMFLSGIISFVGNGLVVYIFSTTKALRTPANLLIINLSFSEFCMMNIMAPVMITGALRESWVFGKIHFILFYFLFNTSNSLIYVIC